MGWNGSGGGSTPVKPKATAKNPSPVRGLIAGLVVVVIGLLGAWYFLGGDSSVAERQGKDRGLIKEATPVKARKQMEKQKRRTVVKTGDKLKDALAEVEASDELVQISVPVRKSKKPIPPLQFNSGVEQVMCWVFSRRLGDAPPPLPSISETELNQMAEILTTKMEIKEDDDEAVKEVKETVNLAKKEMAKFIGDGGTPDEFLRYYVEQQTLAFDEFMEAQRQYQDIHDEDPAMAAEFAKKANEILAKRGIKPIEEEPEEEDEPASDTAQPTI